MKPFLIFGGKEWDGRKGWEHYRKSRNSLEAATLKGRELLEIGQIEWFHVVDFRVSKIVYEEKL